MAQLLLFFFAGIGMIGMSMKPSFQEISRLFRELATLARWAVNQLGGGG
jgi:hypothetical protein